MPYSKVWEIANEAWRESKLKNGKVKKKCVICFNKWKDGGSIPGETPPLFPLDFNRPCPTCGSELKNSFPF